MAECVCRSKVIPATGFWYAVRYSFLERTYLLVFQGMHTPGIQVRNQVCEGAPIGESARDTLVRHPRLIEVVLPPLVHPIGFILRMASCHRILVCCPVLVLRSVQR